MKYVLNRNVKPLNYVHQYMEQCSLTDILCGKANYCVQNNKQIYKMSLHMARTIKHIRKFNNVIHQLKIEAFNENFTTS